MYVYVIISYIVQCIYEFFMIWSVSCLAWDTFVSAFWAMSTVDDIILIIYDVYPHSCALPVPMDQREKISEQLWEVKQQSNNLLMNNEST